MALDVARLSDPLEGASPCGDDLAGTPDFAELAAAFKKHQAQELMIAGELKEEPPPSFDTLLDQATELLERSRDLRLGAYVLWASIHTEGVVGLIEGLAVIEALVRKQWGAGLHPVPEEDADPWERTNVLRELNAKPGKRGLFDVQDALRRVPLVESRQHGKWSFREILLSRGELPAGEGEEVPDAQRVSGALGEQDVEALQRLDGQLDEAIEQVESLEKGVGESSSGWASLDLGDLKGMVKAIKALIGDELGSRGYGTVEEEQAGGQAAGGGGQVLSGEVRDRQGVLMAMDKVLRYYETNEPGSPVPMFVRAAQKLVSMSFIDIMGKVDSSTMTRLKEIGEG